jgi:aerobic-type carbon monoxide dehydrogenase small subunit (CoxS/CutS family)
MTQSVLSVNEQRATVDVDPDTPLLYVLKNDLALRGPRFGCGLAQCGSCSVLLDGKEIRSCVMPVSAVQGGAITTRSPRTLRRRLPPARGA